MSEGQQPCRYFLSGGCTRGNLCMFAHVQTATRNALWQGGAETVEASQSSVESLEQEKPACRYFAQGKCAKADMCPFSHHTSSDRADFTPFQAKTAERTTGLGAKRDATNHVQASFRGACRFHAEGNCVKGLTCPFAHNDADVQNDEDQFAGSWLKGKDCNTLSHHQQASALGACRFYAQGNCAKGLRCPFSHSDGDATDACDDADQTAGSRPDDIDSTGASAQPEVEPERGACRFYAQGNCTKGLA
eukprot:3610884-Rhodomonas_salina.1